MGRFIYSGAKTKKCIGALDIYDENPAERSDNCQRPTKRPHHSAGHRARKHFAQQSPSKLTRTALYLLALPISSRGAWYRQLLHAGPSPTPAPGTTPAPFTPIKTEGYLGCFQDDRKTRIFPATRSSSLTGMNAAVRSARSRLGRPVLPGLGSSRCFRISSPFLSSCYPSKESCLFRLVSKQIIGVVCLHIEVLDLQKASSMPVLQYTM